MPSACWGWTLTTTATQNRGDVATNRVEYEKKTGGWNVGSRLLMIDFHYPAHSGNPTDSLSWRGSYLDDLPFGRIVQGSPLTADAESLSLGNGFHGLTCFTTHGVTNWSFRRGWPEEISIFTVFWHANGLSRQRMKWRWGLLHQSSAENRTGTHGPENGIYEASIIMCFISPIAFVSGKMMFKLFPYGIISVVSFVSGRTYVVLAC